MVSPLSRNAVDAAVGVNTQRCSNITGSDCHNGQASFWYSQGCFIGCPTCDNESGRRQVDLCGLGKKQTLTDPKYWSVGRDAVPGSPQDIYKHNPWRAPGSAPVMDACGLAGGTYSRSPGAEAGDYTKTQYAQHGDVGTEVLKPLEGYTPPVYKLGGTAEVTWSMREWPAAVFNPRFLRTTLSCLSLPLPHFAPNTQATTTVEAVSLHSARPPALRRARPAAHQPTTDFCACVRCDACAPPLRGQTNIASARSPQATSRSLRRRASRRTHSTL